MSLSININYICLRRCQRSEVSRKAYYTQEILISDEQHLLKNYQSHIILGIYLCILPESLSPMGRTFASPLHTM